MTVEQRFIVAMLTGCATAILPDMQSQEYNMRMSSSSTMPLSHSHSSARKLLWLDHKLLACMLMLRSPALQIMPMAQVLPRGRTQHCFSAQRHTMPALLAPCAALLAPCAALLVPCAAPAQQTTRRRLCRLCWIRQRLPGRVLARCPTEPAQSRPWPCPTHPHPLECSVAAQHPGPHRRPPPDRGAGWGGRIL